MSAFPLSKANSIPTYTTHYSHSPPLSIRLCTYSSPVSLAPVPPLPLFDYQKFVATRRVLGPPLAARSCLTSHLLPATPLFAVVIVRASSLLPAASGGGVIRVKGAILVRRCHLACRRLASSCDRLVQV